MKKRQIPTIIGLTILILGITASVFFINRSTHWFSRAAPETTPKQIKFTNITDGGFSVSWVTDEATSGFIKYGAGSKLDQTARDDRYKLTNQIGSFTTHHVTLENLKPNTIYQFQIGSGGSSYDNNGQNYKITTAPKLTGTLPPSDVAYGVVNNQSGTAAEGTIVYLSLPGVTPQSTLVKNSGNWVIPLNLSFSESLSSYAQYDKQVTIAQILVQGENQGTATAVVTTKNDSPVPTITLGGSYDFRTNAPTPSEEDEATNASKFNFEKIGSPKEPVTATEIVITNPEENEKINTQKPAIKGTGPTGKNLEISIESSQTYTDTIIVDEEGNWQWTPPSNLEPGEHTITITYEDEQNQERTLSRTFTVLAAGESQLPSLTSTPSGEASPSATPSPSPSFSASPSPTVSPSARKSMPSTEEGVPTSGNLTPTFLVFIIGVVLISFGFFGNSLIKKRTFLND